MKLTDIEHRVRQVPWPAPPPDLRARVLSAVSVVGQPITWSDRMWFSRAWRLSAVAAALVVVGLEYLSGVPRSAELAPAPQALVEARAVDEIGRQAGLPSDVAESLAGRSLAEAARPGLAEQAWTTLPALAPEGVRR